MPGVTRRCVAEVLSEAGHGDTGRGMSKEARVVASVALCFAIARGVETVNGVIEPGS